MQIRIDLPEVLCARCGVSSHLPARQVIRLPPGAPGGAVDENGTHWRVITEELPTTWVPHPKGLLCQRCGEAWLELAAGFITTTDNDISTLIEIASKRRDAVVVVTSEPSPPPFWVRGGAAPTPIAHKPSNVGPAQGHMVQAKISVPMSVPVQAKVSGPMINAAPPSNVQAAPPLPAVTVSGPHLVAPPPPSVSPDPIAPQVSAPFQLLPAK